jgi:ribosomal protein S12 methylthiotransferase
VHFVSLGCPKNRVDSEVMLGHLAESGYVHATQAEGADLIVVNTCAFIDAAKEESVDAILEMAKLKQSGSAQKLVVAGCLSQRYAPDLAKDIPEVDHFLGTGNFETISTVIGAGNPRLPVLGQAKPGAKKPHARLQGRNKLVPFAHQDPSGKAAIPDPDFTLSSASPRVATQPRYTSYVKVSEGCSNTCAFCIIPKLRGPQRSRSIADIAREVEGLLAKGVVEVNLIAQDLCAFGKDRDGGETLDALLRELDRLGGDRDQFWIRCLYAYPRGLTEAVMDAIGEGRHVLPYLDMPLQHIADPILRSQRRGKGGAATWDLVRRLRERVPGLTLRTTFITGLPGETNADFEELVRFVQEIRFERVGIFTYSPEEDTPAATMADQVAPELAAERRDYLMGVQLDISRAQQQAMVGTSLEVLVEGVSDESDLLLQGRHKGQAPEIDGMTYITDGTASPGDVVRILVDQAGDYDVAGGITPPSARPMDLPSPERYA